MATLARPRGERFRSCGDVRGAPSRLFEWRQREEEQRPQQQQQQARGLCRPVQLFAFDSTGEKVAFHTSRSHTVAGVKLLLADATAMPVSQMRLSWRGMILDDARTLLSYGVTDGQCLHLTRAAESSLRSPGRSFELTVHCVDDSPRPLLAKLRVRVRACDTVAQVKQELADVTGIAASEQRLTAGGRTMNNETRLGDYGIKDESTVVQLSRPFGDSELPSTALERNARLATRCAALERSDFPVAVRELWSRGRRHRVDLTLDTTVRHIKERLAVLSGVSPERQLLLHRGRTLLDDLTANYYNLEGGDSLDLAVAGGAQGQGRQPPQGRADARAGPAPGGTRGARRQPPRAPAQGAGPRR